MWLDSIKMESKIKRRKGEGVECWNWGTISLDFVWDVFIGSLFAAFGS